MDAKILIVEAETIAALELETCLLRLGCKVTGIVSSLSAAIRKIGEEERPDIVLMDVHMQGAQPDTGMTGQLDAYGSIPVIYLTTASEGGTPQRGNVEYPCVSLVKPVQENELRVAIEAAFYQRGLANKIREQEQFIERLTATLPDIVYIINLSDGKSAFSNRAMFDVLGYDMEEARVSGLHIQDLIHPDDLELFTRSSRQIVFSADGESTELECRVKHADGSWRWLHTRNIVFSRDPDGRVKQFLGVAQDITERKQAEEALKKSERKFRKLVNDVNDGFYTTDIYGRLTFVNDALARLLGCEDQKPLIGQRVVNLMSSSESLGSLRKRYRAALNSGGSMTVETDFLRPDGSRVFWEVKPQVTFDSEKPVGNQGIVRDITARKQAEEALRYSEAQFRRVVENINDALIINGVNGCVLFANDQFLALFGLEREELSAIAVEDWIAPEYRRQLRDRHQMRLRGESVQARFECEGIHRDGRRLWLEISVVSMYDESGNLTGTQSIIRDITERKQSEDGIYRLNRELEQRVQERTMELQKLNADLEFRILERTTDLQSANVLLAALEKAAIAVNRSLNLDGVLDQILEQARVIISCRGINLMLIENEHAYIVRRIGYEGYRQLERNLSDFQYPLTWPTFDYMIKTGKSILIADTQDHPQWYASAATEWVRSFIGLPLKIEEQIVGFLNASHDAPDFFDEQHVSILDALATHASLAIQKTRLINELQNTLETEKKMRDQLVQADKLVALGKMVAVIAHEINNPIQTIKNTFYLLQDHISENQQAQEYLGIAVTEANRIAELIEQLRETYRPESRTYISINLEDLISDVRFVLEPQMKKKNVIWQQAANDRRYLVFGVRNNLKQVLLNVCLNAIEAMDVDGGGRLILGMRADLEGENVGIEVSNTGPQIPQDVIQRIFEPFFTTKGLGTGLGLSISYEIIRHHNGEIVVNRNADRDVSFIVWLPLMREHG